MTALRKPLLMTAGWLCVALGMLGVIMPLFPTTPFLLVAVWAFSRSSPELAERIRCHRIVGPYIRDWEEAGVIPVKAKALAVVMMSAMLAYVHFMADVSGWVTAAVALTFLAISAFVISRPSRRI